MKINITQKQFKHLLDLAYLGEWTANSSNIHAEHSEEYDELFQYVSSFAKAFGYDELMTLDKQTNKYFPTRAYEDQMQLLIDENEEDVFWQQLTSRLARRDLANEVEKPKNPDDSLRRYFEIEEKYENEFVENGISRIMLPPKNESQ